MSLPAGHAVVGWATAEAVPYRPRWRWWQLFLFAAVIGNLPDLDFVAGLAAGDPDRWHHGATHSIAAALLVGAIGGMAFRSRGRPFFRSALLTGSVYLSHVLLDLVTPQRASEGSGVALLWPVTSRRFSLSIPYPGWLHEALALERGRGPGGFVESLVSLDMLSALAVEMLLFLPVLVLAVLLRWARAREASHAQTGASGTG